MLLPNSFFPIHHIVRLWNNVLSADDENKKNENEFIFKIRDIFFKLSEIVTLVSPSHAQDESLRKRNLRQKIHCEACGAIFL